MKRIYKRLEKLLERLREKSFRENKGLGNEIGFHIFDYDPEDEIIVRDRIKYIQDQFKSESSSIQLFDLYDILIEIITQEDDIEDFFDIEKEDGKEELFNTVKDFISDGDAIVDYIQEHYDGESIVFLIGLGRAWPILRSHTILNKLHSVITKSPLVMFYPGTYDGQDLILFNEFKDNHYYRAFRLVER